MKNIIFIALFFALGFIFTGETNAQTVTGSVNTPSKGGVTRGYITLKIPSGLHVNSYLPKSEYAIPTRISLSAAGANAYGVTYPAGKMRKFSFSDEPISVYEGTVVFGFKVAVPKNFKGKYVNVKASVRMQACTDEVCYAPKTKTINIRARVR